MDSLRDSGVDESHVGHCEDTVLLSDADVDGLEQEIISLCHEEYFDPHGEHAQKYEELILDVMNLCEDPSNRQVDESVPSDRPAGESVPSNRPAGESVPSNRPAGESVPSNCPVGESVPSNRPAGESVPSNRQVDESVPSNRQVDESVPSNRQVDESVPSNRPVDESVPSNRPAGESVPSNRQVDESVPSNRQVDESVPSNRPAGESVPSNRPADENVLSVTVGADEERSLPCDQSFESDGMQRALFSPRTPGRFRGIEKIRNQSFLEMNDDNDDDDDNDDCFTLLSSVEAHDHSRTRSSQSASTSTKSSDDTLNTTTQESFLANIDDMVVIDEYCGESTDQDEPRDERNKKSCTTESQSQGSQLNHMISPCRRLQARLSGNKKPKDKNIELIDLDLHPDSDDSLLNELSQDSPSRNIIKFPAVTEVESESRSNTCNPSDKFNRVGSNNLVITAGSREKRCAVVQKLKVVCDSSEIDGELESMLAGNNFDIGEESTANATKDLERPKPLEDRPDPFGIKTSKVLPRSCMDNCKKVSVFDRLGPTVKQLKMKLFGNQKEFSHNSIPSTSSSDESNLMKDPVIKKHIDTKAAPIIQKLEWPKNESKDLVIVKQINTKAPPIIQKLVQCDTNWPKNEQKKTVITNHIDTKAPPIIQKLELCDTNWPKTEPSEGEEEARIADLIKKFEEENAKWSVKEENTKFTFTEENVKWTVTDSTSFDEESEDGTLGQVVETGDTDWIKQEPESALTITGATVSTLIQQFEGNASAATKEEPSNEVKPVTKHHLPNLRRMVVHMNQTKAKLVMRKWGSEGIPSPEVNLTCATYLRKKTSAQGTMEIGILEGDHHYASKLSKNSAMGRKRKLEEAEHEVDQSECHQDKKQKLSQETKDQELQQKAFESKIDENTKKKLEDIRAQYDSRARSIRNDEHQQLREVECQFSARLRGIQARQFQQLDRLACLPFNHITNCRYFQLQKNHYEEQKHLENRRNADIDAITARFRRIYRAERERLVRENDVILESCNMQKAASSLFLPDVEYVELDVSGQRDKRCRTEKSYLPQDIAELIMEEEKLYDMFYAN